MKQYIKEALHILRESDFATIESLMWLLQIYKLTNFYVLRKNI